VQNIVDSLQSKMGDGTDQVSALMETAQEHGLPMDKIQGLLGSLGVDVGDLMEKASDFFGEGADDAKGGLGGLMGMAKGLLGK